MAELINKDAIDDLQFALKDGAAGFYIVTASTGMQKQLRNAFMAENVAVYDYSGKENRDSFSPRELFHFVEDNKDKEVFFILNFQIPFLGKQPVTTQSDYFALNLSRDALHAYNKKIFFFTSKEEEKNISIAAMDFFDYCFHRIDFEDGKKEEIEQQIRRIDKDRQNVHHQAEIEYRLNRYSEKIVEYLNIEKIAPPTDKKTENYLLIAARDLSYFAGLYEKISNFGEALKLYYKALDIREKILGKEHAHTADVYNGIGVVYEKKGDYDKALEYLEKALVIRENVLGEEHPGTATTYNHIAVVYHNRSDYENSLEYYGKALAIREKVLGKEHPDTATTCFGIAGVYENKGYHRKALEYYKEALAIREKVLGKEHPDTATACNYLAAVYYAQGDYIKALKYCKKGLAIEGFMLEEMLLGKEHPDT